MSGETDDPRELARKLAEQAKARSLAKQLAEQAKARAGAAAKPAPAPAPKKSLAERAKAPLSAKDALARALAEERAREEATAKAPAPAPKAAPAAAPAAPAPQAAPAPVQAAPAPQAPADVTDAPAHAARPAADILAAKLPQATVLGETPVQNVAVFEALWTAHRARALAEGDWRLVASADVLANAVRHLGPGGLSAVRLQLADGTWAGFVDRRNGVLLAMAPQADILLAGVS